MNSKKKPISIRRFEKRRTVDRIKIGRCRSGRSYSSYDPSVWVPIEEFEDAGPYSKILVGKCRGGRTFSQTGYGRIPGELPGDSE